MTRARSFVLTLTVVLAGFAGIASTPVLAKPLPPVAPVVVDSATQSFATTPAAEQYWTAARMGRARQAKAPRAPQAAQARTTARTVEPLAAGQVTVPPAAGTLAAPRAEPLAAKVTRPYTNRPDRLNGKIFFSDAGVDYVCSGTVVNSTNKDMVDTAGHCISNGQGRYVTNWVFVPGYASNPSGGNAGMYPYGIWRARSLATTYQWHRYGNIKQDYGYGVLAPLNNRHIATYLGGQGTRFNTDRNQVYTAFGYPARAPFNGMDQRVSVSRRNGDDLLLDGLPGPRPMRIASNQTAGCSGGGWLISVSATTGLGYVNGHNSYRYASGSVYDASRMYSPYYGAEALALYNHARLK